MAYGKIYEFIFQSSNGATVEIDVLKDGYAGASTQRPLGGAPVLRQQLSGGVAGSSLAFTPECHVDGEFSQFYTTDAKEYKVELYRNNAKIWSGFIVPELYSEPDIAPPYDVNITAADGLGELKRYNFLPYGKVTLHALFTNLLSYTGQSLDINYISKLTYSGTAYNAFFTNTYIDLDYKVGENCYDVLQYLLATFHATISYYNGCWLIARENDVTFNASGKPVYITDAGVASAYADGLMDVTAMGAGGLWPVEFTTSTVDPALKSVEVKAPWNLVSGLANSAMLEDSGWTKSGSVTYNTSMMGYSLQPYAYISQSITQLMSKPLLLAIDAAMYLYRRTPTGTGIQMYSQVYLTVTFVKNGVTRYLAEDEQGGISWTTTESKIKFRIESGSSRDTSTRNEVNVPQIYDENDQPVSGTLTVTIGADQVQGLRLFGAYLTVAAEDGYKDYLNINNGARGSAEEVEIAIGYETSDLADHKGYYAGILLNGSNNLVTSLSTDNFSNLDYLSLISRDYARSVALPRLRTDGTLDTPSALTIRPLIVYYRNVNRWVETFEWDLLQDNFNFSALGLPSAVLIVSGETILATGSAAGSAANTVSRIEPGSGGEGEDGLTIMLSNYAHVFEATANGYAKAATDNVYVRAFRGSTQVATNVGTITGQETGLSVTKMNNDSTSTTLIVSATTSLHTAGNLIIPVTAGGVTVNLRYGWSLAPQGETGATGSQGPAGADGADGAPGKSPRGPSDYSSTVQYSGIDGTGDFIDYVFNSDHSKMYVCIKTPPVGTPLTNTTYWQESTIQDFVATKVFYAEYGYVQNLGANAVKIATSGGTGYGGFMPPNTEGNGNTVFWAGASTPATSPFTIDKDGNIKATSGTFAGYLQMPFEYITSGASQTSYNSYTLADKCNLYAAGENLTLYLPCDSAQLGKVVNIWDVPVKTQSSVNGLVIRTSVANSLYDKSAYNTYGLASKTYINTGHGGYLQLVAVPGPNSDVAWMVTVNSCYGFTLG